MVIDFYDVEQHLELVFGKGPISGAFRTSFRAAAPSPRHRHYA